VSRATQIELLVPTAPPQGVRRVRRPVRISGKAVPDSECELVGIGDGVLYLRSERRIADTSAVNVTFERTQLSGYVSSCVPVEGGWDVSISLLSGRRKEVRIPTGEYLSVGIVGRNGTKRYHCTVVDRSASGLGVRFAKHVAPGTRIYVEFESSMLLAKFAIAARRKMATSWRASRFWNASRMRVRSTRSRKLCTSCAGRFRRDYAARQCAR